MPPELKLIAIGTILPFPKLHDMADGKDFHK
jgi:hypothetical protein